ncbi:hypothetical protein Lesp02_08520 [Lentzea sp. NBRC 105346]|uniref:DUF397 domain-containing protein n=1 Tax=Lentzea sp. NBRC 105346 TaxID=3032205 RepID=UPI0024A0A569|nr:DUF397 domain-containing protein [Lentzea sp. NBRC 105346]GLZ28662.1 hypothetical protein Lesp02_08520 [Lentzea sp. NBRC 105346]
MATWRKSSYSATGDSCVEVGRGIGIRDTKAPAVHLPVSASAWSRFLASVRVVGAVVPEHPRD